MNQQKESDNLKFRDCHFPCYYPGNTSLKCFCLFLRIVAIKKLIKNITVRITPTPIAPVIPPSWVPFSI